MKKMLDEIKKLDIDYEVPSDFSKKVINKIKAERGSNSKIINIKLGRFIKYVIPCVSTVAVLVIAVIVTNNNPRNINSATSSLIGRMNTLESVQSIDLLGNTKTASDIQTVEENITKMNEANVGMDSATGMNATDSEEYESVKLSRDEELKTIIPSNGVTDKYRTETVALQENTDKIEESLQLENIEDLLKAGNIEYIKEDDTLILENVRIEDILELLHDVADSITITEDENIIRIEMN